MFCDKEVGLPKAIYQVVVNNDSYPKCVNIYVWQKKRFIATKLIILQFILDFVF